jgi:hypothetical protein
MRNTMAASVRRRRSWSQQADRQEAPLLEREASPQRVPTQADKGSCQPRNQTVGKVGAAIGSVQAERAPAPMKRLSVRAQNVLKELALELTGEQSPKGNWSPSRELLRALTAERLAAARNCGPQTLREIVDWAQGCGVTIRPVIPPGGSLSQMWSGLIANASAGALTRAEVVGALQRSVRRKSVRIPIGFQIVLVKILLSGIE